MLESTDVTKVTSDTQRSNELSWASHESVSICKRAQQTTTGGLARRQVVAPDSRGWLALDCAARLWSRKKRSQVESKYKKENIMKVYKRGSEPKGCLYVGRGSSWGNPYRIGYDGTRAEVIQKFRLYAIQRLAKEKDWLIPLVGKDLVCHCAPKPCHADVIIELINDLRIAQR